MHHLPLSLLILIIFAEFSCTPNETDRQPTRPNIVFIMSDDHAYQAISAYDNRLIETPNIDRIAKMGVLFTNASVTNSICAPSRATILTGKHSHINGKVDNHFPFDTTNITFPQLLHEAGYQTAMFGKLHFGNNPKGFDQFKILPGQGAYYNPDFITKDEGTVRVEGYVTDIITDMTIDWLENDRKDDQPFLLMYLHKAPHREWLMAERHFKDFTTRTFPEPPTLFDDYSGRGRPAREAEMNLLTDMHWAGDSKIYPEVMKELGIVGTSNWDEEAFEREVGRMNPTQREKWDAAYSQVNEDFKKAYPSMTQEGQMKWRYQRYMQDYLGTIKSVDENVGRVLDYLEQNGLMENTIIVYTSDQGFYLGEHGWYDKRFVYNESFKTPLLMTWPGKTPQGVRSDALVQNLDFAQTFLEAAELTPPSDMQGQSLMPFLLGTGDDWQRDAVYYHYYEYPSIHMVKRHYAIITKDFKLVHYYFDTDEWELIDRKNDPNELKNVYDDPEYAEVRTTLHGKLEALREKYGDNWQISQRYIDEYLDFLQERGSFAGAKDTSLVNQIFRNRRKN